MQEMQEAMQEIDTTQSQGQGTQPRRRWLTGRLLFLYAIVLAVLMVALLPPLINVNRFQTADRNQHRRQPGTSRTSGPR